MTGAGGDSRPVVCCDLDGVVWRGETPIEGSAAGVARLRDAGLRVVFLTNNSSGRVADNVARLAAAGVDTDPDDLVTSAQAAVALLARDRPARAPGAETTVLTCAAGPGVVEALHAAGFEPVDSGPVDAVVVGWNRDFDFDRLRRAADAVRAGARFVATNLDPTYPAANGLLPGAGSLVAAVATAGGSPSGGRGEARARDGGARPRPLRGSGGDDRRPTVDRRRVRGRSGRALRAGALGNRRACGRGADPRTGARVRRRRPRRARARLVAAFRPASL